MAKDQKMVVVIFAVRDDMYYDSLTAFYIPYQNSFSEN